MMRIPWLAALGVGTTVVVACFVLGTGARPASTVAPIAIASAAATPAAATPSDQSLGEGGSANDSELVDPGDSPAATPYSETDEARAQWQPVVVHFAQAFVRGDPEHPDRWLARLRPLMSQDLAASLATVDQTKIPYGSYSGWQVVTYGETTVTVQIDYRDTPRRVTVKLLTDGDSWTIVSIA